MTSTAKMQKSEYILHSLFNHFPPELRIITRKRLSKDGNNTFDSIFPFNLSRDKI